eukprot:3319140-Rhodomonas_salina.1
MAPFASGSLVPRRTKRQYHTEYQAAEGVARASPSTSSRTKALQPRYTSDAVQKKQGGLR